MAGPAPAPADAAKEAQQKRAAEYAKFLEEYQGDSQRLWLELVAPAAPSKQAFARLTAATGVLFKDAAPKPSSMDKEHAGRAIRALGEHIRIGEAPPPEPERVDFVLEFTGLDKPAIVVLAKNDAYFEGKVYYAPGLAAAMGTNMHADRGY